MNREEYYANLALAKENELMHFGTPGMKWGQRRYQNEDGSLTPAGRARYGGVNGKLAAVNDFKARAVTGIGNHVPTKMATGGSRVLGGYYQGRADAFDKAHKSKGVIQKARYLAGQGGNAEIFKGLSRGYQDASSLYKDGGLRKAHTKSQAYNMEQFAKHAQKKHDMGANIIKRSWENMKMPFTTTIKTSAGRNTTMAGEAAIAMLTAGIGNTVLDLSYIATGKTKKYATGDDYRKRV